MTELQRGIEIVNGTVVREDAQGFGFGVARAQQAAGGFRIGGFGEAVENFRGLRVAPIVASVVEKRGRLRGIAAGDEAHPCAGFFG